MLMLSSSRSGFDRLSGSYQKCEVAALSLWGTVTVSTEAQGESPPERRYGDVVTGRLAEQESEATRRSVALARR
jgi:hypothetical protein